MRWPWQRKLQPPFNELDRRRTVALANADFDKYGWSDWTLEFAKGSQRRAQERVAAFPDAFADPDGWKEPAEIETGG